MAVLRVVVDYGIPFIVILSILVFVHEFGHYLLARWAGVRVEVFSIGFGREIRGWTDRRGTRWKVSWIPLGGYVKMLGEGDDEEGAESPGVREDSFVAKSVGKRAAIIAAGPLANFIFAVVIFAALFSLVGRPSLQATVGHIEAGSPAAVAGFLVGDRIAAVDGRPIAWFDDLKSEVSRLPGAKAVFDVVRGDQAVAIEATLAAVTVAAGDGRSVTVGRLGVGPNPSQIGYIRLDPVSAIGTAIDRSFAMTVQIFSYLGGVITGSQPANELGGPIRIAQMSGEMAQAGLFEVIFFMAILSLNLALINVLPIPMLDGGHLVFLAAEALRGRPVTPRVQEYSFRFGLILVLLVLVFATWNDLGEIHLFE